MSSRSPLPPLPLPPLDVTSCLYFRPITLWWPLSCGSLSVSLPFVPWVTCHIHPSSQWTLCSPPLPTKSPNLAAFVTQHSKSIYQYLKKFLLLLSSSSSFNIYLLNFICMFYPHACICTFLVPVEARRGCRILWNWILRVVSFNLLKHHVQPSVLAGIQTKVLCKRASALHH